MPQSRRCSPSHELAVAGSLPFEVTGDVDEADIDEADVDDANDPRDIDPDVPTLWLYACVPAADRGGVQAVFRRLTDVLETRGFHLNVAWAHPLPDRRTTHRHLPLATAMARPFGGAGAFLRSLARLARALRADRPAVVNVHFPMGQVLYFNLLRPLFRYRLVLSLHGSDLLQPRGPARHLLGTFLRRADAVTVVSKALEREALERYRVDPARLHVIPNGVDVDFWRAGDGAPGASDDVPGEKSRGQVRLVALGRLVPVKGFDVLIDAMRDLVERWPSILLEIVGEGPERASLQRRIDDARLGRHVRLTGHLDAVAVRERLQAATLFVLPSRSEGLPLSLLEALATGTPAIASDVGGVAEVWPATSGCLVEPDDAEALGASIAALLEDPARQSALVDLANEVALGNRIVHTDAAYARLLRSLARPATPSSSADTA